MTLEEENQNLQWLLGFIKDNLNRNKNEIKRLKEEKIQLTAGVSIQCSQYRGIK